MLYAGSIYKFGNRTTDWQRLTDYVEQRRTGKAAIEVKPAHPKPRNIPMSTVTPSAIATCSSAICCRAVGLTGGLACCCIMISNQSVLSEITLCSSPAWVNIGSFAHAYAGSLTGPPLWCRCEAARAITEFAG